MAIDKLLKPAEVAERLRVEPRTLAKWRSAGKGPVYVKMGAIRYPESRLNEWLESNLKEPAAERTKLQPGTSRRADLDWRKGAALRLYGAMGHRTQDAVKSRKSRTVEGKSDA